MRLRPALPRLRLLELGRLGGVRWLGPCRRRARAGAEAIGGPQQVRAEVAGPAPGIGLPAQGARVRRPLPPRLLRGPRGCGRRRGHRLQQARLAGSVPALGRGPGPAPRARHPRQPGGGALVEQARRAPGDLRHGDLHAAVLPHQGQHPVAGAERDVRGSRNGRHASSARAVRGLRTRTGRDPSEGRAAPGPRRAAELRGTTRPRAAETQPHRVGEPAAVLHRPRRRQRRRGVAGSDARRTETTRRRADPAASRPVRLHRGRPRGRPPGRRRRAAARPRRGRGRSGYWGGGGAAPPPRSVAPLL